MFDPDESFQKLCLEAVRKCGSDMSAVERYVLKRIDAMDPADRDRIKGEIERVLSFRAPGFHEHGPH